MRGRASMSFICAGDQESIVADLCGESRIYGGRL